MGTDGGGNGRDHSVLGGWLGAYYYKDSTRLPVRFEATFRLEQGDEGAAEAGRFGGVILDDGYLGEAAVRKGVQQGLIVRFTKVYLQGTVRQGIVPVHYAGTLSEDGKLITGTWRLSTLRGGQGRRITETGYWEARRLWSEASESAGEPEETSEGQERERERELVTARAW
jgi:hypothetical protein